MNPEIEITITVKYSCIHCETADQPVKVPARGATEDIVIWMEKTINLISLDHHSRSPHCFPETLSKVMIPVGSANQVGGPSVN